MSDRESYIPGPASGARIEKNGDTWTLVLVRELKHAPEIVWKGLTDPEHVKQWAPFEVSTNLVAGAKVEITTVGAPAEYAKSEGTVKRAEPNKVLEYNWGQQDMRWELEAAGTGTRLTLWSNIDRNYIAMGAAGWHICFDVLDHLLRGTPIGRITGPDAMKFRGWQKLHVEYGQLFGKEEAGLS